MFNDIQGEAEFADNYARQRRLRAAGVGVSEWYEPSTTSERRELITAGRARYGDAPSPVRSLPPARRTETASARPGMASRGVPTPRALVDVLIDEDARICGHPTCKTVSINREGPTPEFCPEHRG